MLEKKQKREFRHKRVRAKISGTMEVPRLCVFRSAGHIYGQLIDDERGKTIVSVSDREVQKVVKKKTKEKNLKSKTAIAHETGKLLADKAAKSKIGKVVFDRGGYKYHGRVKALAEGAREGGLKF